MEDNESLKILLRSTTSYRPPLSGDIIMIARITLYHFIGGDKGSIIIVITMLENISGLLQFFWLWKSFSVSHFKTTYKVVPHFAFRMMWSKFSPCNLWYAAQWSRNRGGQCPPPQHWISPPFLSWIGVLTNQLTRIKHVVSRKWRTTFFWTLLNDNNYTLVLQ